jgi:hypothetical protein
MRDPPHCADRDNLSQCIRIEDALRLPPWIVGRSLPTPRHHADAVG